MRSIPQVLWNKVWHLLKKASENPSHLKKEIPAPFNALRDECRSSLFRTASKVIDEGIVNNYVRPESWGSYYCKVTGLVDEQNPTEVHST